MQTWRDYTAKRLKIFQHWLKVKVNGNKVEKKRKEKCWLWKANRAKGCNIETGSEIGGPAYTQVSCHSSVESLLPRVLDYLSAAKGYCLQLALLRVPHRHPNPRSGKHISIINKVKWINVNISNIFMSNKFQK